jgi:hypothetical protein
MCRLNPESEQAMMAYFEADDNISFPVTAKKMISTRLRKRNLVWTEKIGIGKEHT